MESLAECASIAPETSTRHGPMKVRDVIDLIEHDGWFLIGQRGSHRQFKHPTKPGKVTVAGQLGKDMPTDTLKWILRQAQLEEKRT